MKLRTLLYTSLLLLAPYVKADVVTLATGTPGDGVTSPATSPLPDLGGLLLNFSDLATNADCQSGSVTSCPAFSPTTYGAQGVNISSPDGLIVYPFSVQSGPNELFDNSTDGSANVTIGLSKGATAIGVGIADSDDLNVVNGNNSFTPVSITLQPLGFGGVNLGSPFTVITPQTNPDTAFNGYWVVQDNTSGIYGLRISAPTTGEGGLAIADVQVSPEPSYFFPLIGGVAILAAYRLRKKKAISASILE